MNLSTKSFIERYLIVPQRRNYFSDAKFRIIAISILGIWLAGVSLGNERSLKFRLELNSRQSGFTKKSA